MDILSLKREVISKLPPVHCTCDKPLFKGDYMVGLHYWCDNDHDYLFAEENAYFDGKEFHLYDINLQDNANWIDDWVYFAANWQHEINEKYISEVNRAWRFPNPKYCKFNPKTKKYEILKEDKLKFLKE